MSLRQISKDIGISKSYLSDLLKGKRYIKDNMYAKLIKYYDLTLNQEIKISYKISNFKLKEEVK